MVQRIFHTEFRVEQISNTNYQVRHKQVVGSWSSELYNYLGKTKNQMFSFFLPGLAKILFIKYFSNS